MTLSANIEWEVRAHASANIDNGGGFRWFSLVNSTYKWTSSGSGTNEYYVELSGGGDPSLTEATSVTTDGTFNLDTNGTLGSLNAGEWDWGDNDTLGYSTVYVRLDDGADPDSKFDDFVGMGIGGGTDYSQQNGPQLTLTDLATSGAGVTTLTSATGGFTAIMVGNVIKIASGTNVTSGWYEVTARSDTNTVTLDRAPDNGGGGISSGNGKLGGSVAIAAGDKFFEAQIAGQTIHIAADDTHTLTANSIANNDGTEALPIRMIGYGSARHDDPMDTSRPLIAAGASYIQLDNFWEIINLRCTGTSTQILRLDTGGRFYNVKAVNSSGTSGRSAASIAGVDAIAIQIEFESTNGEAITTTTGRLTMINCYLHDSDIGIDFSGDILLVLNCIIDTCGTDGIKLSGTSDYVRLMNNVLYGNGVGINFNNGTHLLVINNILDNNTTGLTITTWSDSNFIDYNVWGDNTTDVSGGARKGPNAITGDPGLTDPANGDFTLGSGSNAIDAGLQPDTNMGLTGDYNINIGVDQDDVAAGGSTPFPVSMPTAMPIPIDPMAY